VAIATIVQGVDESLSEVWKRFKVWLRKCPNHGFEVEMQVYTFCTGLQLQKEKMILDASFGGLVLFKTAEEAITIIECTTSIDMRSQYGRAHAQKR